MTKPPESDGRGLRPSDLGTSFSTRGPEAAQPPIRSVISPDKGVDAGRQLGRSSSDSRRTGPDRPINGAGLIGGPDSDPIMSGSARQDSAGATTVSQELAEPRIPEDTDRQAKFFSEARPTSSSASSEPVFMSSAGGGSDADGDAGDRDVPTITDTAPESASEGKPDDRTDAARDTGSEHRDRMEHRETNPTADHATEATDAPDLDELVDRVRGDEFRRQDAYDRAHGVRHESSPFAGKSREEKDVINRQYERGRHDNYQTDADAVEVTADTLIASGKDPYARDNYGDGKVRDSDMWGREAIQTADALDGLRHDMLGEVADQAAAVDEALARGDITPEEHKIQRARVEAEAKDEITDRVKDLTGSETTDRYYTDRGRRGWQEPVTFDNAPEALMYAGAHDQDGLRSRAGEEGRDPRDAAYAGQAADATSGEGMRSNDDRHRESHEHHLLRNAVIRGQVAGTLRPTYEEYIDRHSGERRIHRTTEVVIDPSAEYTKDDAIRVLKLKEANDQGRGGVIRDPKNPINPYGLEWDESRRDWFPSEGNGATWGSRATGGESGGTARTRSDASAGRGATRSPSPAGALGSGEGASYGTATSRRGSSESGTTTHRSESRSGRTIEPANIPDSLLDHGRAAAYGSSEAAKGGAIQTGLLGRPDQDAVERRGQEARRAVAEDLHRQRAALAEALGSATKKEGINMIASRLPLPEGVDPEKVRREQAKQIYNQITNK